MVISSLVVLGCIRVSGAVGAQGIASLHPNTVLAVSLAITALYALPNAFLSRDPAFTRDSLNQDMVVLQAILAELYAITQDSGLTTTLTGLQNELITTEDCVRVYSGGRQVQTIQEVQQEEAKQLAVPSSALLSEPKPILQPLTKVGGAEEETNAAAAVAPALRGGANESADI